MGKNKIRIILILIIIAIILLVGYFLITKLKNNESQEQYLDENSLKIIVVTEEINKDGKIENLANASWNSARIKQQDGKMEVSINLNNNSETEKIEARILTVKLINKSKDIIATKDVRMEEIPEDYGYTTLDIEFEIKEEILIDDIQIIAK